MSEFFRCAARSRVTHARTDFDSAECLRDERILRDTTLYGLVCCTVNQRVATDSWQRAVDAAIAAGHPERLIAKAAGVTGPAIHQRKQKLAETTVSSKTPRQGGAS